MCNSFGPFVKSIRKQIFISLLVLGVIIYFFIIQQRSTQITFEEALDEILSDQTIKKLMIADDKNENVVEIVDDKLVNELMKDSAHMVLKQVEDISIEPLYNITLYTKEYKIYALQVNETTVRIGRDFYTVRGNNIFLESIKRLTRKEPAIE
ncbi:hypothetical protein QNH47_09195 [Virgibacillus halodenitrificans]|uniref:hypothetical protein n=1 Tax=Virgibacillus halodenitrificans TaxID=1482 RepID=UPI0024C05F82|nr:hypothetical protein [Virgibacillus halodenitrificans]WHX28003.1 hypothetical protein QNH47_09195 [Virgibacillus halodenitrificans]